MKDIERRFIDCGKVEIRRAGGEGEVKTVTIRGYAAKFNVLSENLGGFREQIAPGAFDKVLDNDVRALFNHDENMILGRTLSGTVRLFADATGLGYEVDLPDTQYARDLAVSIERGDVSQSSFAFSVDYRGDDWSENDEGVIIRTINAVKRLYDVSPVTYPAYPDATIGMRSLQAWKTQQNGDSSPENLLKTTQKRASRARELALLNA